MTNREIMRSALKKQTIPFLLKHGFEGQYPNFRRKRGERIDLLYFQTNKWGGAFTVEVLPAFLKGTDTNGNLSEDAVERDEDLNLSGKRYRLPGMFDGWFYYSDVYRKRTLRFGNIYQDVSEKQAEGYVPPKGFRFVQKFSEETASEIAAEVNRQLAKAFRRLDRSFKG